MILQNSKTYDDIRVPSRLCGKPFRGTTVRSYLEKFLFKCHALDNLYSSYAVLFITVDFYAYNITQIEPGVITIVA